MSEKRRYYKRRLVFLKRGCIKLSLFYFQNTIYSAEKKILKNIEKMFDIFLKI
jgi:hypothetical protein